MSIANFQYRYSLAKVILPENRRFTALGYTRLQPTLHLALDPSIEKLSEKSTAQFYFVENQESVLAKVRFQKSYKRFHCVKSFVRFCSKTLLFKNDARKEYRPNKVFRNSGLEVVDTYGWLQALNPAEGPYSIFFSKYKGEFPCLQDILSQMTQKQKLQVMGAVCRDVIKLSEKGFVPGDLNPSGVLIQDALQPLYIDTNVEVAPQSKKNFLQIVEREILIKFPEDMASFGRYFFANNCRV